LFHGSTFLLIESIVGSTFSPCIEAPSPSKSNLITHPIDNTLPTNFDCIEQEDKKDEIIGNYVEERRLDEPSKEYEGKGQEEN
jgi:hypothetical protein